MHHCRRYGEHEPCAHSRLALLLLVELQAADHDLAAEVVVAVELAGEVVELAAAAAAEVASSEGRRSADLTTSI
jgi:hypothetical protein